MAGPDGAVHAAAMDNRSRILLRLHHRGLPAPAHPVSGSSDDPQQVAGAAVPWTAGVVAP